MITNYDPFGFGYMLYTVRNRCDEVPDLEYKDGLQFLYFNTTGTLGGNEELKRLLMFIQKSESKNATDVATKRLHDYISLVKESPEARAEYMMWEEKIFYERRDAREEERIRMVRKKLEKNKSIEQIAGELEISVEEAAAYVKLIGEK